MKISFKQLKARVDNGYNTIIGFNSKLGVVTYEVTDSDDIEYVDKKTVNLVTKFSTGNVKVNIVSIGNIDTGKYIAVDEVTNACIKPKHSKVEIYANTNPELRYTLFSLYLFYKLSAVLGKENVSLKIHDWWTGNNPDPIPEDTYSIYIGFPFTNSDNPFSMRISGNSTIKKAFLDKVKTVLRNFGILVDPSVDSELELINKLAIWDIQEGDAMRYLPGIVGLIGTAKKVFEEVNTDRLHGSDSMYKIIDVLDSILTHHSGKEVEEILNFKKYKDKFQDKFEIYERIYCEEIFRKNLNKDLNERYSAFFVEDINIVNYNGGYGEDSLIKRFLMLYPRTAIYGFGGYKNSKALIYIDDSEYPENDLLSLITHLRSNHDIESTEIHYV